MKTLKTLKTELVEARQQNSALQDRLTAATDTAAERTNVADQARAAAANAERARVEAVAARDAALTATAEMQRVLDAALIARDEWAATAEATARERQDAQEQAQLAVTERNEAWRERDAIRELVAADREAAQQERDEAVRECASAQEDARVLAERLEHAGDALQGSEESRLMGERKLAEVQQALDDCRQSRGIIQAQRDTILSAAAEQGIMIPTPGGPTPKVAVSSGEDLPLVTCPRPDAHHGHRWTPPLGAEGEQAWCDGCNPDGTIPYDPARTAVQVAAAADNPDVILEHFGVRDQSVTIGGEEVPTVVGGRAVPLPEGFSGEPGPGSAERLAEQLQAARLGRDRALIDLSETRRKLDIERQENDREQAELARQRDALQDWRDTALQALYFAGVAQGEAFKVRAALEEDLARVRKELDEMSQFAEMRFGEERAAQVAALPEDTRVLVEHGYAEMHSRLGVMMEERDNLLVENEALNREREDALSALQQVKAERDELRPLAALTDAVVAQDQIVKATERMNRAEAEFGNLRRERDAWSERAETHEQERDEQARAHEQWRADCLAAQADLREATRSWESAMRKVVEERDAARAELASVRHMAMDSMMLDGAMENALGKLVGVLGAEAYESPADVIDTATDAIKDARREAGRLKLVLDIIDERKSAQPVEVERRGNDDV